MNKRTILFLFFFIFLANLFLSQEIYCAINSDFTPRWQIGDSWEVTMRQMAISRIPEIEQKYLINKIAPSIIRRIYFKVIDHGIINNDKCYVVEVGYKDEWSKHEGSNTLLHLYVHEDDFTLQQVIEVTETDLGEITERINYPNENGRDFVNFASDLADFSIFCDFPNFPATNTNEERTVKIPDSEQTMTQRVTFIDNNTVKIELSTNVSGGTYKTTQLWERGKPWWSSCKREFTYKDYETGEMKTRIEYDPVLVGTDTTPPALQLTVTPTTLWPPNHEMVEIKPTITVSDNYDKYPDVKIESVTSNEPDKENEDTQITENGKIFVRAERDGKGSSRIYTITYSATDFSGNKIAVSTTVTVPHDPGKK